MGETEHDPEVDCDPDEIKYFRCPDPLGQIVTYDPQDGPDPCDCGNHDGDEPFVYLVLTDPPEDGDEDGENAFTLDADGSIFVGGLEPECRLVTPHG